MTRVLVREPPEYPRADHAPRPQAMTGAVLRTSGHKGTVDMSVSIPSGAEPDIIRLGERLYVHGKGRDLGVWREAKVWPIVAVDTSGE